MTSTDFEGVASHVAGEHEPLAVATQRNVLGHVPAGRQQQCLSAGCWNRIQVWPTILIRKKDNAVVRAPPPAEVGASVSGRYRAGERLGRFPEPLGCTGRRIGGPDLPRIWPRGPQGSRRTASGRPPGKSITSTLH